MHGTVEAEGERHESKTIKMGIGTEYIRLYRFWKSLNFILNNIGIHLRGLNQRDSNLHSSNVKFAQQVSR